jgi:hypothetical protein
MTSHPHDSERSVMNMVADQAVPAPLLFTTARWCNRRKEDGKWAKVLAHTGPYPQFRYGTDTTDPGYFRHRPGIDGPLQVAIICSAESGLFAIDADKPEQWAASRAAQLVTAEQAVSVRGDHFHILADARHLREMFPVQGATVWGDVKARGFIPLPGSVHYSGARYEPTGRPVITATPGLIAAVMADRTAGTSRGGGTGSGSPRTGDYDHDTARAALVLRGLLGGKPETVIREEWDAMPDHVPGVCSSSSGFTDADFRRHLRTAERKAGEIFARQANDAQWQAMLLRTLQGGAR